MNTSTRAGTQQNMTVSASRWSGRLVSGLRISWEHVGSELWWSSRDNSVKQCLLRSPARTCIRV